MNSDVCVFSDVVGSVNRWIWTDEGSKVPHSLRKKM